MTRPLTRMAASARLNILVADLPDGVWTRDRVRSVRAECPPWLTPARQRCAAEGQRKHEQSKRAVDALQAELSRGKWFHADDGSRELEDYAVQAAMWLSSSAGAGVPYDVAEDAVDRRWPSLTD